MKRSAVRTLLLTGLALLTSFSAISEAKGSSGGKVSVKGYTRKDGTYVAPYTRSAPGAGTSSTSGGTGIPCGNSYISASDTCRIGTTVVTNTTFDNCTEARAAGFHDMLVSNPGYADKLDRDKDGIACESGGGDDVVPSVSTGTVATPVQTLPSGTGGICPEYTLTSRAVIIIIPASFPNPATTKEAASYNCGGNEIKFEGGDYDILRKVTIKSSSWKTAWNILISNSSVAYSMQIDPSGKLDLNNDRVSYINSYPSLSLDKDIVIGLQVNSDSLSPVVFNGNVTPQNLGNGINKIYQKSGLGYTKYQLIEIDTSQQTVILTPKAEFPK